MSKTIGILGGTFDPIHCGHLAIAEHCLKVFNFDAIYFIPCHIPVHRDTPQASAQQRLDMISSAIANISKYKVNTFEIDNNIASYSYNTIQHLRQENTDASLAFILGMDSFASFNTWQNYQEILDLCNLVIVNRPRYELPQAEWSKNILQAKQQTDMATIQSHKSGGIYLTTMSPQEISATQIRNKVRQNSGNIVNVPEAVQQYIIENNLYQPIKGSE